MAMQLPRQLSQVTSSHYATPYQSPQVQVGYPEPSQPSRKRSRQEGFVAEYPVLQQYPPQAIDINAIVPIELTPHGQHAQLQSPSATTHPQYSYHLSPQYYSPAPPNTSQAQPQHHHHRLPTQHPPSKSQRTSYGGEASSPPQDTGASSVVGQAGMPAPAPRPIGPKLKFTPEDDALLVELKETKNLTWKQIADFFPGRSSGTLQVRYCTKLKAKTTVWTDEMIQRLCTAMEEYEDDRWRVISGKVGNGFSAAACQEKANEIKTEHDERNDNDDHGGGGGGGKLAL